MKWYRNKYRKTSHVVTKGWQGDFVKMRCGTFTYTDLLVRDDDCHKCIKCLNIVNKELEERGKCHNHFTK